MPARRDAIQDREQAAGSRFMRGLLYGVVVSVMLWIGAIVAIAGLILKIF